MNEGTELFIEHQGENYSFKGSIGLAPDWIDRGLGLEEERWVSACMLARVNYFGKKVQISMRADRPDSFFELSQEERRDYSIYEGGFFGNLFTDHPVAYTCSGDRTALEAADPILSDRICTQASGNTTQNGDPLTMCNFILTGSCSHPASFLIDNQVYQEVVFIFLKPLAEADLSY